MVTCYNCGKQVSDETLICPECGALVRRYEAPVRNQQTGKEQTNQTGWQTPPYQQYPPRQQEPQDPNLPPYVTQRAGNGKSGFRFSTGFQVWFWLCVAVFALFSYSFLFTGITMLTGSDTAQLVLQMFQASGMDLESIYGSMDILGTFFLVNGIGCILQLVLQFLLYFTRRRRFVLVHLIGSILLTGLLIFLVGLNLVCLMIMVCAIVNHLMLRKQFPAMRL